MNTFLIILCAFVPFALLLLILILYDLTNATGEYNLIIKKPTKKQRINREKQEEADKATAKAIIEEYTQMSTKDLKKELRCLDKAFNDISSEQRERRIHDTVNIYSAMYAVENMCNIGWRMDRIREVLKSRKATS